ncbi:MAG: hypothetical protein KAI74_01805 [Kiritimatiellae bacterium]|nr:hypothetical protein [Kiritimatiellia bacterium]
MKKQISRISVDQTSKVIAILYVIFSLLYSLIGIFMIVFGGPEMKIMGGIYIFMPILMGIFGFIFVALGCWIYNLVAGKFGGIEFEVKDMQNESFVPETTA